MASGDSFSAAFDQVAQPPPTAAPPPPPNPTGDAFTDAFNQAEAPTKPTGSIAEAQKHWWDFADRSILEDSEGRVAKSLAHENEVTGKIVQHEIAQAHPWRAAIGTMYYGTLKDTADLGLSLTSPKMLALQVAGGIQMRATKAAVGLANLYFAWRGAEEMGRERQANETEADFAQRMMFGAAAMTSGAGGAAMDAGSIATLTKQAQLQKLGLSGNLAAKVQQKVDAVDAIRKQAATEVARISAGETAETETIEQQAPVRMGQIVKDAAHAVYQENARVSKPFEEMAAAAKKPVSDAPTIRATILDVIKSHGVQDHEIPPKIFNALTERGLSAEQKPITLGGDVYKPTDRLYQEIVRQKALVEGPEAGQPVTFKDLTRVRGDLWDAKEAATDGTLKNAFADAYDSMTQMQEDYAAKNGFGEKYRAAKNDYRDFKRELGSGLMSDFLKAEDFKQQAMAPRIAKLTTGVHAEALRGLLTLAGVDVSPLDTLTGGKPIKAAVSSIESATAKRASEITVQAGKEIRGLGKQEPIIPGRSNLELAGKTTEEIRADAIHQLASNMKQAGISNPMAMFMLLYGSIRLGMGSPFGGYPAARGAAGMMKGKLLRNTSYQDWLIRESGVDPTNTKLIGRLRQGLKRMAASGALAGAAAQEARRDSN